MRLSNQEAHLARRQCIKDSLDGELDAVSPALRPLFRVIDRLPGGERHAAWAAAASDHPQVLEAIASADPEKPPEETTSEINQSVSCATLEDIALIVANQRYLWKGWIPAGVLSCIAAEPGTGKTRFAMDLARRLWHGLPWPDGQANEYPAGTRTLWIQGDRNFAEMLQVARDFGIPPHGVALATGQDDPLGGLNLDEADTLDALPGWIRSAAPALVIIDTIGMTTGRNLCKPEDARAFFAPLLDMANSTETCFLALTHLSKDKDPLGRRIVEKARSVIKITQPDPDGQPNRRRLWVDKTAVEKPPPLGVTMGTEGNEYDSHPPVEPDLSRPRGPAPVKIVACEQWLVNRLAIAPIKLKELRDEAEAKKFDAKTLYTAKERAGLEEFTEGRCKWWKLPETSGVGDVGDVNF
jgi:hypothetical protein